MIFQRSKPGSLALPDDLALSVAFKQQNHSLAGQTQLGYSAALDGLRALCVLAVLGFHANVPGFGAGYVGVNVFFVISGYLITSLLLAQISICNQKLDVWGVLKRFYGKRALRLLPALLLMLMVFVLWHSIAPRLNPSAQTSNASLGTARALQESAMALLYASNWTRAWDWEGEKHGFWQAPQQLGHTWSLSIEEQFYLIFPALLLGLAVLSQRLSWSARRRAIWLLAVIVALMLASYLSRWVMLQSPISMNRLYNGLDARAEELMWGALAAIFASKQLNLLSAKRREKLLNAINLVAFPAVSTWIFVVYILEFSVQWKQPSYYLRDLSAIGATAAVLVLHLHVCSIHSAGKLSILQRLLALSPLPQIGAMSYGLYLWHFPIFIWMQKVGCTWQTVALGGGLLTFIAAALSFYWLERPLMRWAHIRWGN